MSGRLSLRLRISALVTAAFASVLIGGSFVFLDWFEEQLVVEVRADDTEELERQAELLTALDGVIAFDSTQDEPADFVAVADQFGFFTLVPDDGTFITVTGPDGRVLGDSGDTVAALIDNSVAAEGAAAGDGADGGSGGTGTGAGGDGVGALTPVELTAGFEQLPGLLDRMEDELSPETRAEFDSAMRLVADMSGAEIAADGNGVAVGSAAVPVTPLDEADLRALELLVSDLMFGAGDSSAAAGGRLIVTERPTVVSGQQFLLTAESRVAGIDAAVGAVQRTLWIGIPMLLLLVGGLAYGATGRALRPVEAITGQVERIRSSGAVERVPVPGTGDEINHLAVTMNDMLDRLAAASASQRRFVSDVSHELRTPAAVIRAELEAAQADPDNDWARTVESVLTEQTRLSELVDDLILLARMDEGEGPRRDEVDLDVVVESQTARTWTHPVDAARIEPVKVTGDETQLTRIVQNLLANAGRHATSIVAVSLERRNGHAVLRVDDDGGGVPVGERERIFDRFARLDAARKRDAGGSGLGLAIVRQVAEAHGGTARASNSPMGGARFEVTVPAATDTD